MLNGSCPRKEPSAAGGLSHSWGLLFLLSVLTRGLCSAPSGPEPSPHPVLAGIGCHQPHSCAESPLQLRCHGPACSLTQQPGAWGLCLGRNSSTAGWPPLQPGLIVLLAALAEHLCSSGPELQPALHLMPECLGTLGQARSPLQSCCQTCSNLIPKLTPLNFLLL